MRCGWRVRGNEWPVRVFFRKVRTASGEARAVRKYGIKTCQTLTAFTSQPIRLGRSQVWGSAPTQPPTQHCPRCFGVQHDKAVHIPSGPRAHLHFFYNSYNLWRCVRRTSALVAGSFWRTPHGRLGQSLPEWNEFFVGKVCTCFFVPRQARFRLSSDKVVSS